MGGFGSGARRDPARAKRRIEDCLLAIDSVELARAGIFERDGEGELQIGVHSVALKIERAPKPSLELAFTLSGDGATHGIRQVIPLTTTRPPFGGRRWWLVCPACGRLSGKLYLPVGANGFACRLCHDLIHTSAQAHDDRIYKLRRDPRRLAAILSGAETVSETQFMLAMKAACC